MTDETMSLYDLRVTVERIEGRSVCGLAVGDYFEVTEPGPDPHGIDERRGVELLCLEVLPRLRLA